MRIAIDARKLHDYGIGTYIWNLLRQLARIDAVTEYVLLCREEDAASIGLVGSNFRAVPVHARAYSISEQIRVPMALRRERVDLFHAPRYVLPPLSRRRSIVTIHDASTWCFRSTCPTGRRTTTRRHFSIARPTKPIGF